MTSMAAHEESDLAFRFNGSGGEYFRIWIVNLVLSILTLGIYSAWAKVRRMQYFYRNTEVAGSGFDYHGDPVAILKGRIVAVTMLVAYNVAPSVSPILGVAVALPIGLALPWLLLRSLKFRLYNTSYRGLRFGFHGKIGGAYNIFLAWPFFMAITLYLLGPMWHQRLKSWQHNHSAFGQTRATFGATSGGFYRVYFGALLLLVAVAAVVGLALLIAIGKIHAGGLLATGAPDQSPRELRNIIFIGAFFVAMLVAAGLLVRPYVVARIQNLVWNNTALGPHRFRSTLGARRLMWIALSNFLLTGLTVGLFKPFADVRLARCRVEAMTLAPVGSLEDFMAANEAGVSAVGEEVGEFFDFDIAL